MQTSLEYCCWRGMFTAFLVTFSNAAAATIDVDTVLGPGHPFPNETITVIDGANPPTDLHILEGAVIGGEPGQLAVPTGVDVYGVSIVTMFGGRVVGSQQSVRLNDQSVFRMFGGLIFSRAIEARDVSRVILDGGEWNVVNAYDSSRVGINAGHIGGIFAVNTFGEAHAAINGANKFDFRADEFSTMVINAGFFEGAEVLCSAEVLVNGGSFITGLRVSENAIVRMRDLVTMNEENVDVSGNGIVHVYGTNLRFETDDEERTLVFGTWSDGDNFAFRYRLFDQGQIILHEVPEPGSWGLLAVGALGVSLVTRRRMASWRR